MVNAPRPWTSFVLLAAAAAPIACFRSARRASSGSPPQPAVAKAAPAPEPKPAEMKHPDPKPADEPPAKKPEPKKAALTPAPAPQDAVPAAGLDDADLDASVQPCADFYQYANGGWAKRTTIPDEEASWGAADEVMKRTEERLRALFEGNAGGAAARKLQDFYASALDEDSIAKAGLKPLQPIFARINLLRDPEQLPAILATLHLNSIDVPFASGPDQDAKDATRMIMVVAQSGLGLPERDYYTRADDASAALRKQYKRFIARMFELEGASADAADRRADAVMKLETQLAEGSMPIADARDADKTYHMMKSAELQKLTPLFPWGSYFRALGVAASNVAEVNVAHPKFFEAFGKLLRSASIDDWKSYLHFHVLRRAARFLPKAYEEASFDFYGRALAGVPTMRPRASRAVQMTLALLGDAAGEAYCARYFSPSAKQQAEAMVANLIEAFRERLGTRTWLGDETRRRAAEKLNAIVPKIGYPDRWRDYSACDVKRGASYLENAMTASVFEQKYQLAMLGKPVDRSAWQMSPAVVNAFYNPAMNEIVFPAAILQAPFFDERQAPALNFGAMGSIIGHELTHGFDDQGSKFDAQGNLKNWWTDADRAEFEKRAQSLVRQFDAFKTEAGQPLNGRVTLGENIADLGGVAVSLRAMHRDLAARGAEATAPEADRTFFLAYARAWRSLMRPEALKMQIQSDVHAPARFRAIAPLMNLPEFHAAFGCDGNSAMSRPGGERAEIW